MKSYDWVSDAGKAMASILWRLSSLVPFMVGVAAAGYFIKTVNAGPFELTCKTTEARPATEPYNLIERMKSENE